MENQGGKQKNRPEYYECQKNLDLPPEDQEPENLNFDMDPKQQLEIGKGNYKVKNN